MSEPTGGAAGAVESAAGADARRVFALAILAPYLVWGLLYILRTSFEIDSRRVFCLWDDAMISMRYAANLAAGRGLVWNPGEAPVQGFSNPGVTLLMAALHLLPLRAEHVSLAFQLLALALLVAVVAGSAWLALRTSGDPLEAATAGLAVVTCAPVSVWALQGGDSSLVGPWLLAAVLWQQGASRRGEPWPPGLFVWLGAGALLRPDTLAFSAVFLGVAALFAPRARPLAWLADAALCAVFALGWMGFSALYYGDPLPNTYYLKLTGNPSASVLREGLAQVAAWWEILPCVGLAGIGWMRGYRSTTARLCLLLPAAGFVYHAAVGGDWMSAYGSRFAVPALPLLLLLSVRGAMGLARAVCGEARPALARGLGCALALTAAWLASPEHAMRDWADLSSAPMLRDQNWYNARLGFYFREHSAPDLRVALAWGGVPAYFSERPAVDALGKSDRHIARLPARTFDPGHSKWDWDYVLRERRPDVILDANRGLKERADFRRDYWRVETQGLKYFLRKSSVSLLRDPSALVIDQQSGEQRTLGE